MPRTITKTLTDPERAWLREFCDRYGSQPDVAAEIGCSTEHLNACLNDRNNKALSFDPLWSRLLRLVVRFERKRWDGPDRLDNFAAYVASRKTARELDSMLRHVAKEEPVERGEAAPQRGVVKMGVPS